MKRIFRPLPNSPLQKSFCDPKSQTYSHHHYPHRLPAYHWYRELLKKKDERLAYNRAHRDTEESDVRLMEPPLTGGSLSIEEETNIWPHPNRLKHWRAKITFGFLIVSFCLLVGAIVDLSIGKQGALSAVFTLTLFSASWFAIWRAAERSKNGRLCGHIHGHVTQTSRRMHETLGLNLEVLSITISPDNVRSGPDTPLEIEIIGSPITGEVHHGDTICFFGDWSKNKPIQVSEIFNVTRKGAIRAHRRFLAFNWLWEFVFFGILVLISLLFFLVVRPLLGII